MARRALFVLLLAAAAGCGSVTTVSDARSELLVDQIRSRGVDPETIVVPFEIDDEMRAWVHAHVSSAGQPERRLEQLLHAILQRRGTALTYQNSVTTTAREVWRTNRANCLSFAHLYVGLAREIGLPVYYLRVSDLESFERDGDLVIASEHVTAAFGPPSRRRLLDFAERPLPDSRMTEPLSDLTAVALHYSNRGAEKIRDGLFEEAEALLRNAVRIDPELGDGWVNRGVALRRLGRVEEAEASLRRALEATPQLLVAYTNLAALLEREGRHDEARRLLALIDRRGNRNPFSWLALGDLALRDRRLDEAYRFFRRAQRLHPDQAEPMAALGQWALAAKRWRDAERWLARARAANPSDARTIELARVLRLSP